jgi:hypothetical protein
MNLLSTTAGTCRTALSLPQVHIPSALSPRRHHPLPISIIDLLSRSSDDESRQPFFQITQGPHHTHAASGIFALTAPDSGHQHYWHVPFTALGERECSLASLNYLWCL